MCWGQDKFGLNSIAPLCKDNVNLMVYEKFKRKNLLKGMVIDKPEVPPGIRSGQLSLARPVLRLQVAIGLGDLLIPLNVKQ